jgi:GPI mannosyltransferase 3
MEALQAELAATTATTAAKQQRSVAFLMPCHSTPFYSHLHIQGQQHRGASPLKNPLGKPLKQPLHQRPLLLLRALGCSPEVPRGTSESARFEADALALVNSLYSSSSSSSRSSSTSGSSEQLPEYIVTYPLYSEGALRVWLQQHDYSEVLRVFNTHFSGDADALHTHYHIALLRRSTNKLYCSIRDTPYTM